VYVVGDKDVVEKRVVTLGPSVWKEPPPRPGEVVPGWVMVNQNPGKAPEQGPPPPTREPVPSVVAVVSGLKATDRVIVDGLQRAQPSKPVTPELWEMRAPPTPAKKE
jgi:hypothetical protein